MGRRPNGSCIWGHVEFGNFYYFPQSPRSHTKAQPDVVLLANGGSWMSPENNSTHFSATRSTQEGFRKPGTEYLNPMIQQDMNQKLLPIILDNKDRAKQLALNEYLTTDKEHSLELLRGLNHEI